MQPIVFISSPYNHPDRFVMEENYLKVAKLANRLIHKGVVAISPVAYGHNLLSLTEKEIPGDWDFWKAFCFTLIDKSDEVYVYKIPGWDKSGGVREEIEYATSKGIKVTYIDPE